MVLVLYLHFFMQCTFCANKFFFVTTIFAKIELFGQLDFFVIPVNGLKKYLGNS
jgi:hypothetical protein